MNYWRNNRQAKMTGEEGARGRELMNKLQKVTAQIL